MTDWFLNLDRDTQSAVWIITVGAITNAACALVGVYLVLRRMSLLGDAISHAVLPGLVVAFVLSGSMNIGAMFLGAMCAAMLTTFLTQTISRYGGVPADASMGVVFTSLFALGVVLVSRYGTGVHLDVDCLLYGNIIGVDIYVIEDPFLLRILAAIGIDGSILPRSLLSVGLVLVVNLAAIVMFWKELKISSFDPALASTMGMNATAMHYLLMVLVALTTVAAFEQVGSILVVAMLIVPGATAHLLSDRLSRVLWIAAGVGVFSSVAGYGLAVWLDTEISSCMSVVAGTCYLTAVLFSPRYGLISQFARRAGVSLRIVSEDVLAMLFRLEELAAGRLMGPRETRAAVGGGLLGWLALRALHVRGHIQLAHSGVQLTDAGRQRASGLVRSHRLWEAYLVQHLRLPADHVHDPANRMEHYIDRGLQQRLVDDVTDANTDPHGREIPDEA